MRPKTVVMAAATAIALASVSGCAMTPRPAGASQNRVSGEELAATNARTVYEALERVRPAWLTSRGQVSVSDPSEATANVYMHGARVGGLEYLRQVYVIDVAELRFWSAAEASARFGMGNPRGVIEIIPRT